MIKDPVFFWVLHANYTMSMLELTVLVSWNWEMPTLSWRKERRMWVGKTPEWEWSSVSTFLNPEASGSLSKCPHRLLSAVRIVTFHFKLIILTIHFYACFCRMCNCKMVKYHIFNIKCMNSLGCFTAQRSAHEHPAVERQDVDHCSVLGGLQMVLRGQNFTSESKVIFFEKTHGE